MIFKNYPLNHFKMKINSLKTSLSFEGERLEVRSSIILSSEEISSFFHFPDRSQNETSLLKVTAKKLALPIWCPTFDFDKIIVNNSAEIIEDIMAYIPESRKKDVIIFNPTDEKFPFCLNPFEAIGIQNLNMFWEWFFWLC